jgi:hypothetical protein
MLQEIPALLFQFHSYALQLVSSHHPQRLNIRKRRLHAQYKKAEPVRDCSKQKEHSKLICRRKYQCPALYRRTVRGLARHGLCERSCER